MTGVLGEATVRELDLGMIGSVVSPGDPDYETARGVWNHAIDKRPALIVRAASTRRWRAPRVRATRQTFRRMSHGHVQHETRWRAMEKARSM